jgi:tRNA-splicing ligase RtcB
MDTITGKTLVEWGYSPGNWFSDAIADAEARRLEGASEAEIRAAIDRRVPPPGLPLRAPAALAHRLNIRAEGPDEVENLASRRASYERAHAVAHNQGRRRHA